MNKYDSQALHSYSIGAFIWLVFLSNLILTVVDLCLLIKISFIVIVLGIVFLGISFLPGYFYWHNRKKRRKIKRKIKRKAQICDGCINSCNIRIKVYGFLGEFFTYLSLIFIVISVCIFFIGVIV